MGVGAYQMQVPFGSVTEKDGRLISLEEKPSLSMVVNRGIYVLDPHFLALVPAAGEFPMTALFDRLLEKTLPVSVFHFDDYWLDVGRPADLSQANGLTSRLAPEGCAGDPAQARRSRS